MRKVAEPYIRQTVKNEKYDAAKIAALLHQRTEVLTEIPEKVDFFDTLPDYDTALFVHKKSKTDLPGCLDTLRRLLPELEALEVWDNDGILGVMTAMAERDGVKNAKVMWPVRIAVAGKAVTPGGASELAEIFGKAETLRRIKIGIERLEKAV